MSEWKITESEVKLRDYFAAAALQGMMAHGAYLDDNPIDDVVEDCYRYADALIEAGAREEGTK